MGVGEVVGIMFVIVSVVLLGLEWLSREAGEDAALVEDQGPEARRLQSR